MINITVFILLDFREFRVMMICLPVLIMTIRSSFSFSFSGFFLFFEKGTKGERKSWGGENIKNQSPREWVTRVRSGIQLTCFLRISDHPDGISVEGGAGGGPTLILVAPRVLTDRCTRGTEIIRFDPPIYMSPMAGLKSESTLWPKKKIRINPIFSTPKFSLAHSRLAQML